MSTPVNSSAAMTSAAFALASSRVPPILPVQSNAKITSALAGRAVTSTVLFSPTNSPGHNVASIDDGMTVALTGNARKSAIVKSTNTVFIITHHLSNSYLEISLKHLGNDNYGKSSRLTHHLSQTEASLSSFTDLSLAPSDESRLLQSMPLSNSTSVVSAALI